MSESSTRIGKRRGSAPGIANTIMIQDDRIYNENEVQGPLDNPNIDLDNLQRGARSVSMTCGPIKEVVRNRNQIRGMWNTSVAKPKTNITDIKNECQQPIMWEFRNTFSNLAKNKQRMVVNFEQNRIDVEAIDLTFRKIGLEDISFEQTMTKYPKIKHYFDAKKIAEDALKLQESLDTKGEEIWLNDTDTERRCYYPVLKPRYERPRRFKNNSPTQNKSKVNIQINGQEKGLNKTITPPKQKTSERNLELPSNVSNRSLRCRSFTSVNGNSDNTRNGLTSDKSHEGEFKTFVLTAMDPSVNTSKSDTKEDDEEENKRVEIIKEEKKFEIKSRVVLAPIKDQIPQKPPAPQIKFYDKVKKVQNDIIKKGNFSPNFEKPLRAQFERLLASLSGKSHLGRRNVSLGAALRKEVASMPATYKLY